MQTEERSFLPVEGRRVGEWKSPNLLGMSNEERDGALLDSLAQLHRCVETGHRASNTARARQGRALRAVQGDVADVKDAVRTMKVSMGLEEPRPGETRQVAIVHAQHPPGVMAWSPKKLIGWVAAIMTGAFATVQGLVLAIQATDWSGVAETLEKLSQLVGRLG
jgi:hypothetical protein